MGAPVALFAARGPAQRSAEPAPQEMKDCVCPQDGGAPDLEKRKRSMLHALVYTRSIWLQYSYRTALHAL